MEKKIIYISPSTQQSNIGAGSYGSEEYRMNQIADSLEKILEETGRYIIYRNDPQMSVSEIIAQSNRINPDIHVTIHSNAGRRKRSRSFCI